MLWELASIKLRGGPNGLAAEQVRAAQRDRLLRSMAEVVGQVGYADTTVRRLLAHAVISRRTYYELFTDKEDCYLAAYDEATTHVFSLVRTATTSFTGARERIEAGLAALLGFCADNPLIARAFIVEVLAAGEQARNHRARTMETLAVMTATALADDHPRPGMAALAGQAFVGGVHEVIYAPIDRGEVEVLPMLAPALIEAQIGALVPA